MIYTHVQYDILYMINLHWNMELFNSCLEAVCSNILIFKDIVIYTVYYSGPVKHK